MFNTTFKRTAGSSISGECDLTCMFKEWMKAASLIY